MESVSSVAPARATFDQWRCVHGLLLGTRDLASSDPAAASKDVESASPATARRRNPRTGASARGCSGVDRASDVIATDGDRASSHQPSSPRETSGPGPDRKSRCAEAPTPRSLVRMHQRRDAPETSGESRSLRIRTRFVGTSGSRVEGLWRRAAACAGPHVSGGRKIGSRGPCTGSRTRRRMSLLHRRRGRLNATVASSMHQQSVMRS